MWWSWCFELLTWASGGGVYLLDDEKKKFTDTNELIWAEWALEIESFGRIIHACIIFNNIQPPIEILI